METYYERNRQKCLEYQKAWKRANPEHVSRHNATEKAKEGRRRNFKMSKYGLTLEEYDSLLLSQNNICELCKEPFGQSGSDRPVLDHSHETKKVRAFIHDRCNVGLGRFGDDPTKCRLAAEYLEKHTLVNPAQTPKK